MRRHLLGTLLLLQLLISSPVMANPFAKFLQFKRVDADPAKSYALSDQNGPWLILACSFAGPTAEKQSRELVLELRRRFQMNAYTHQQTYDFTDSVAGKGFDRYGNPKSMRHGQNVRFNEVAVLVGDFVTIDDPKLQETLKQIKYMQPNTLNLKRQSSQRFVGLRMAHQLISGDKKKQQKGPMGSAFVTRNPRIPKEFFTSNNLDPFVVRMNQGVEYSLLKNKKPYTVRIATFRGESITHPEKNGSQFKYRGGISKLEAAAEKANKLTSYLRRNNIEAYEFHDRYESIVTVGGFETVGDPRSDGRTELNPAIHKLMQQYGPQSRSLPGQLASGLQPRQINGIVLDLQPIPVRVPRQSIGSTFARTYDR